MLAACSAGLFVVTALLWAVSFSVAYRIDREKYAAEQRNWREAHIALASGRVSIWFGRQYLAPSRERPTSEQRWGLSQDAYWYARRAGYFAGWDLWEFRWDRTKGPGNFGIQGFCQIGFNLAPIIILSSILPLVWRISALRARFRTTSGRCAKCGYDLRATPGQCPECGVGWQHLPTPSPPT